MKLITIIFISLLFLVFATGCKKEVLCEGAEQATLYYTPDCSTIKGYVTLKNGTTLVFQHDIDEKFQKSGVDVCIQYDIEDPVILSADCAQGDVITINSLELR